MSTINCTGTTKSQTFPAGTVETPYSMTLSGGPSGFSPVTLTNNFAPSQSFVGVPNGTYTLTVTKNGVSASTSVTVAPPVTVVVPDTITATVS